MTNWTIRPKSLATGRGWFFLAFGLLFAVLANAQTGLPAVDVKPAFPNLTVNRPLWLCEAPDGTGRLFLIEQEGRLLILPKDRQGSTAKVFLDISSRHPQVDNEEGFLGMAFHPDFKNNGKLYIHYNQQEPRRSVISEVRVSKTDPDTADLSTERVLLEVPQPYGNHKGGCLAFGPDGYLYLSFGDGGTVMGDPHNHGQRLNVLLGKILRIDVNTSAGNLKYGIPSDNPFVGKEGARPEIYCYGMRNPWRMSFDRKTGDLWVGDVGQDLWEEIDLITKGGNYGWRIREGFHPYKTNGVPADLKLTDPVIEYPHKAEMSATHSPGMSVTGGFVYRGKKIPALDGVYIYGDFVMGTIWGLRYEGGKVKAHATLVEMPRNANPPRNISAFGQDNAGEVYALAFDGKIYEFVEKR
jgi:quinoprotein glucose dehydrogenase